MALEPLVPLQAQLVGNSTQAGMYTPTGLNAGRSPWAPDPGNVRTSSFPTPLAIEEATRFLLSLSDDERTGLSGEGAQLVEASSLLLQGLVAGALVFRWLPIDGLASSSLAKALRGALTNHVPRFGLISTPGGEVWGFLARDGIPCLAGRRWGNVQGLRSLLAEQAVPAGRVSALLEPLRSRLVSEGRWSPNVPWMGLVERIQRLGAPEAIDLAEDVCSIGPFDLPLAPRPELQESEPRQRLYLLGYAPGSVGRLARFLGCPVRRPGDAGSQPDRVELLFDKRVLAAFPCVRAASVSAQDLGEGVVVDLAAQLPDGVRPLADLTGIPLLKADYQAHLTAIKTDCVSRGMSLVKALELAPYLLSDVARVVARYAPNLVGESSNVAFSPALEDHAKSRGLRKPSAPEIEALQASGRAFLLQPALAGARSMAFLEDGLHPGDDARFAVGDLSCLGLSLWLAFTGIRHSPATGYMDDDGSPLFDTGAGEFVLLTPDSNQAWWRGRSKEAARLRLGTLQRFLVSYPRSLAPATPAPGARPGPTDSPVAKLFAAAARCFVARLLGSEDEVRGLLLNGAGLAGRPNPAVAPVNVRGFEQIAIVQDAWL